MALIVLGLELATGAFSEALATIGQVLAAVRAGDRTAVYLPTFFLGLGFVAVGVLGLAAATWSRVVRRRLVRGKSCPECDSRTTRIPRRRRHRLLARITGDEIHRRICTECGWKGLSRIRGN